MEENGRTPYVVLPIEMLDDNRLSGNEKLLYARIESLTHECGFCWATNKYLAEKCGVTTRSITDMVANLKKCGYIYTHMIKSSNPKEFDKRIIVLADVVNKLLVQECIEIGRQNADPYGSKLLGGVEENFHTPMEANFYDNNIMANKIKEIIEKIYKREIDLAKNKDKDSKPYQPYKSFGEKKKSNPNDRYWGPTPKCTRAELSDEVF